MDMDTIISYDELNFLAEVNKTFDCIFSVEKKNNKLYGPFLWIGFNCLKARATSSRQFTFYFFEMLKGDKFIKFYTLEQKIFFVWLLLMIHYSCLQWKFQSIIQNTSKITSKNVHDIEDFSVKSICFSILPPLEKDSAKESVLLSYVLWIC